MAASNELPQPPYFLVFEEGDSNEPPLTVMVDDRAAIPLFTSPETAASFLSSTDFGAGLEQVEISEEALIEVLQTYRDQVGHVALDPPPAGESGMKVRMGSVTELIEALRQSQQGDDLDLFDFGGFSQN